MAKSLTPHDSRNRSSLGIGGAASAGVHLVVFGIAALIGINLPEVSTGPSLDSRWTETIPNVELNTVADISLEELTLDSGGISAKEHGADTTSAAPATVPTWTAAWETPQSIGEFFTPAWTADNVATTFQLRKPQTGQGAGSGNSLGDEAGFFGLSPTLGRRIVYVVDNSRSMNRPHDSSAKTRFKRVQVELVNSIWQLEPQQQFYVVFFNFETVPMPSRRMQWATPLAKEHYLTWVAETRAEGAPTDPIEAMELALSFQPDIIYFLTDGNFARGANSQLLKIRQPHTAIHTFAFGDEISEAVLSGIAKNTGGTFTLIP